MMNTMRYFTGLMIATIVILQLGCGKKTKADDAHVTITPSQPIVFSAPFSYSLNGTSVSIAPPWFSFGVNLNNKTGDTITIIALTATITGLGSGGAIVDSTATFTPSLANYSNDVVTCTYNTFGTFENNDNLPLFTNNSISGCVASRPVFYVGSNPDPGNGALNFTYQVKLQIDGWFGTEIKPKDRFRKFVYFSTQ
jgi:hypothetical protein